MGRKGKTKSLLKRRKFAETKLKAKQMNPFELKINTRKHNALNVRRQKCEIGRPGLSRSIGEKKV